MAPNSNRDCANTAELQWQSDNPFVSIPGYAYVFTRTIVIAYLSSFVLLASHSATSDTTSVFRIATHIAATLVTTVPLLLRLPGLGVFHPLYFLSAYAFLKGTLPTIAVSAIGVTSHPALPHAFGHDIAQIQIYVESLSMLSWLMLYAGYASVSGSKWRYLRIYDRPSRLWWGSWIATAAGVTALALLIRSSGGLSEHLKNISRGIVARVYLHTPELINLYAVMVVLTLVGPAVWLLQRRDATRHPFFWITSVFAVAAMFIVSGRRTGILQAVVLLVSCWILSKRTVPLARIIPIALFLFGCVGVLGDFRKSNWNNTGEVSLVAFEEASLESLLAQSLTEMESRSAGGPIYAIIAKVPNDTPYLYGRNYIGYLNLFVPRQFWPDKPRGIGFQCASIFYGRHNQGGIPPGTLGEAYWSGGVVGIIVVFLIWGGVLKYLATFFISYGHTAIGCLLYLLTVTTLAPAEPAFRRWLFLIVPTVLILAVMGMIRVRSQSESAA